MIFVFFIPFAHQGGLDMNKKLRAWLVFLIFLNGYVSLSLELVVLRQLSFWVGSSAVITSIIMGTFLGFMSLGYFLGESKKIAGKNIRKILCASFITIAILALLAASFPLVLKYFVWMYQGGITSSVIQTFIYSFIFLSVGPFLFGFNTTLLSRCLHRYNTNYTGNIMAWDTIGSVLGSLLTTLILMPFVGVNNTVMLIVLLASVAAIITRPKWWTVLLGILIMIPTIMINNNIVQRDRYGILVNNANSTISVLQNGDTRLLYMNGLPMSVYNPKNGTMAEYIDYINRAFIYSLPPDRVHKILVLGAGGFTAGLDDTYNEYTFVDIEYTLRDITEKYFLGRPLTNNKRFVVQDASQFLKNTDEKYDLILVDVYSNSFQVPEGFITAEFMQRVKSRIADDGILIMNVIASISFQDKYTQVFDNTFHTVFPYNTQRQVVGFMNPWVPNDVANIMYIWYNRDNDGRIYTINKTPVIYDRYAK